jgi:hypothetical protein
MAPHSAGAERMSSMLKTLLGRNQDSPLADFTRSTMMLHYNKTKRASGSARPYGACRDTTTERNFCEIDARFSTPTKYRV